MNVSYLALLGLLFALVWPGHAAPRPKPSAACDFALTLGMELTAERTDRVVDVRLLDAALNTVAQLEARIDGEDERTLFVTATEGADRDGRWLEALLAGALERAPGVRTADVYLTGAEFRAAIIPLLNHDRPPSQGLPRTMRYEVLRRMGFAGTATCRFEAVGDDGENELQVRLIVDRDPDVGTSGAAPTRLQ